MSSVGGSCVPEVNPAAAWEQLESDTTSALIDVRTKAEWAFVGQPDLTALGRSVHSVEWQKFPGMTPNSDFVSELKDSLGTQNVTALFFICRSGARSLKAAEVFAEFCAGEGREITCVNIAEGFEGDLDSEQKRGGLNGWKARGLPWRQT